MQIWVSKKFRKENYQEDRWVTLQPCIAQTPVFLWKLGKTGWHKSRGIKFLGAKTLFFGISLTEKTVTLHCKDSSMFMKIGKREETQNEHQLFSCLGKSFLNPHFLLENWIYDCLNEFYSWSHWKIHLFCPVIMVYFFH